MMKSAINHYLKNNGFGGFFPKAVFFDMDGVLYNSMPNHAYAWHHSMKTYKVEMSEAEAYKYEGMRGVETIKLLTKAQWQRDISDEEAEKMYAEKSRVFATRPAATIMPGVINLMKTIKSKEMGIVVVTGSGQHSLLKQLTTDFNGFVISKLIVSAFDVKRGKPHPEPYLKALSLSGISPNEAIVVENAPLGVRAAKAAGIFTIAVNTGPLADELLSNEGADCVVKSMAEAEALISLLPISE